MSVNFYHHMVENIYYHLYLSFSCVWGVLILEQFVLKILQLTHYRSEVVFTLVVIDKNICK